MTTPIPFRPDRFRSAVPYYLDGRPAYPSRLIRRVAECCGLDGSHRVLDLGCGPGPLAIAFAGFAADVVGIDPDPAMLAAGAEAARLAGCRITFREGSSYDLGPDLGRFRLVTIGRAFHWMDRPATVRQLDALIEPAGAIALFGDNNPDVPDNRWRGAYKTVVERYSDEDEHVRLINSPDWLRNEAVFLDSAFSQLEIVAAIDRRRIPVEQLVNRAFSISRTVPARLGPRSLDFAQDLRAALQDHAIDGMVTEVVKTTALIARRPIR